MLVIVSVEIIFLPQYECGILWKKSTRFHVVYLKKNIKFAKSNVIINKLKRKIRFNPFGMKLDLIILK